ncbi:MAG TPA: PEP-CTERM sorting domain-containing protein [Vicinamibacterales bacterium]
MRRAIVIVGMAIAGVAFQAHRAAADPIPIPVSVDLIGSVRGAEIDEDWTVTFPKFAVSFFELTHLQPGFCFDCDNGTALTFAQSTGPFAGPACISCTTGFNARVAGDVSFVGPDFVVDLDQFGFFRIDAPVTFSGTLAVAEGSGTLFRGTLVGSGTATMSVESLPPGPRLAGYEYHVSGVSGVAATPEPTSILLLGSGLLWFLPRRRKDSAGTN